MDVREETLRQIYGDAHAGDLADVAWVREDGRVQVRPTRWLVARRGEQAAGGRVCPWPEGGRALVERLRDAGGSWTSRGVVLPAGEGERTLEERRARARARASVALAGELREGR